MHRRMRDLRTGLLFVAPWLLGFIVLTVYAFAVTFHWSFCRFDWLTPPQWIGWENYARLVDETRARREFGQALWNTAYYAAVSIPATIVLGVLLAQALNVRRVGRTTARVLVFVPSIIPTVASSLLWMLLLDPQRGAVNRLLRPLGARPTWLNSPASLLDPWDWWQGRAGLGSKDALVLMSLWGVGNFVVIYLAALRDIPRELHEAAELDGAGPIRRFWSITLPLLTPLIFFNAVMGLVAAVQYFTQAYVVSGGTGGPQGSTRLLSLHIMLWAFKYLDVGYASACAWVLWLLVTALTCILFRSAARWVYYGA